MFLFMFCLFTVYVYVQVNKQNINKQKHKLCTACLLIHVWFSMTRRGRRCHGHGPCLGEAAHLPGGAGARGPGRGEDHGSSLDARYSSLSCNLSYITDMRYIFEKIYILTDYITYYFYIYRFYFLVSGFVNITNSYFPTFLGDKDGLYIFDMAYCKTINQIYHHIVNLLYSFYHTHFVFPQLYRIFPEQRSPNNGAKLCVQGQGWETNQPPASWRLCWKALARFGGHHPRSGAESALQRWDANDLKVKLCKNESPSRCT